MCIGNGRLFLGAIVRDVAEEINAGDDAKDNSLTSAAALGVNGALRMHDDSKMVLVKERRQMRQCCRNANLNGEQKSERERKREKRNKVIYIEREREGTK